MTWLFVDGNNAAARSHHQPSLYDLRANDGTRTGTIYGFLKSLSWAMHRTRVGPDRTVVFWDCGRSNYRLKRLPTYKGGRKLHTPKTPEDEEKSISYLSQCATIEEILGFREFRQIKVPGVEADDLIGIFSDFVGDHVVVFSGDRDMWQLLGPTVSVMDPKSDDFVVPADCFSKFGVYPNTLALAKALAGDTSDNIPGLKQIGKKRAAIICQYLTVNNSLVESGMKLILDPRYAEEAPKTHRGFCEKAAAPASQKIIKRNLVLTRIPKSWDRSLYEDHHAEQALTQWLMPGTRDTRKFLEALSRYDIDAGSVVGW